MKHKQFDRLDCSSVIQTALTTAVTLLQKKAKLEEEIQQQEHVWLGGLKKFVVEVTRESASAGNSPQKGARPVALAETTGMAAEEDEEEDPGAFFQDLLARK